MRADYNAVRMGIFRFILLGLLVYFVVRFIRGQLRPHAPGQQAPNPEHGNAPAHQVLGVAPSASQQEIRAAYQKMVQQYHPDRVAAMGPELRDLAEKRTKEINAAYEEMKRGL